MKKFFQIVGWPVRLLIIVPVVLVWFFTGLINPNAYDYAKGLDGIKAFVNGELE